MCTIICLEKLPNQIIIKESYNAVSGMRSKEYTKYTIYLANRGSYERDSFMKLHMNVSEQYKAQKRHKHKALSHTIEKEH